MYHNQNMFVQTFQICVDISNIFTYTDNTCSMFKLIIYKCHVYHKWISQMDITNGMVLEKLRLEDELKTLYDTNETVIYTYQLLEDQAKGCMEVIDSLEIIHCIL